jgi:uncharacterized protein (UPF0333 family)
VYKFKALDTRIEMSMEFSIIVLVLLSLIVIALFAFCMTEPRGKNTVHARRDSSQSPVNNVKTGVNQDPISHSYDVKYKIKTNKTEAA